jgi:hypothetical protein
MCVASPALEMAELLEYNSAMARNELLDVNPDLWDHWLWFVDAREELNSKVLLNEFHLTGLIICRMSAMQIKEHPDKVSLCGCTSDDMHTSTSLSGYFALDRKQYVHMSMREVKNHVVQTQMHMYDMCNTGSIQETQSHLTALFTRLGQLLLYNLAEDEDMYDDLEGLQPGPTSANKSRIFTESTVRWYMNVFYILFRSLHLYRIAKEPVTRSEVRALKIFHVEAALDVFYEHTMRWDLPPGAVLCYQHEFVGMFNSISQVVYYNFPDYERRRQLEWSVVATGKHAIYSLAPLLSLYPDVQLIFEEEPLHCIPGKEGVEPSNVGWRMMLTPGVLYMLSPTGEVFYHENVCELISVKPNTAES